MPWQLHGQRAESVRREMVVHLRQLPVGGVHYPPKTWLGEELRRSQMGGGVGGDHVREMMAGF